ncbi:MAG: hypothetical protein AB8E87_12585 [Prochlorococcus sp.]
MSTFFDAKKRNACFVDEIDGCEAIENGGCAESTKQEANLAHDAPSYFTTDLKEAPKAEAPNSG